MKAKIIKKGTAVLVNSRDGLQASVIKSGPFMYKKQLCATLVGFGKRPIYLSRLEVV